MHGRVKVKTTAEQEEERRKEREKKLQIYKAATNSVFEKRQKGELTDEVLETTAQILQGNPDDYTFWNIRKEILEKYLEEKRDDLKTYGINELALTEACLKRNPKSYWAWHHRGWVMERFPEMNWDKDLYLCDLYLEMDERNFHCWDYRRLVCHHAKVTPEKELEFTMRKINSNFSNYSSWHYRSSLLPEVHPGPQKNTVQEDVLLKEYELVQNATFTDPGDQSAWFYHRWLLGRGRPPLLFGLVFVSRPRKQIIVQLTKPVAMLKSEMSLTAILDGNKLTPAWKSPSQCQSSSVWYLDIPEELIHMDQQHKIEVYIETSDHNSHSSLTCTLKAFEQDASAFGKVPRQYLFSSELSAAASSVLQQELDSCRQLNELEPENKWPMLTCILLMKALDGQTHHVSIVDFLTKLPEIDCLRKNYYDDLRSRFTIENIIEQLNSEDIMVSLAGKHLTSLYHTDHLVLMREVNLSHNSLRSLRPAAFLLRIQKVDLDDNLLTNCSGLELLQELEELSLRRNNISSLKGISQLESCPKLSSLNLEGNPFSGEEEYVKLTSSLLKQLKSVDGQIL